MRISLLLLTGAIALFSFKPNGFGDLVPDTDPSVTFSTQSGNHVSCKTKVNMPGFVGLTTKFVVGFYLSPDTTIDTNDQLIGTFTVNPAGLSTVNCTLNNIDLAALSVGNGTYYIGTYVDIHNDVAENGMTPEIPNNSWAFRNSGGEFTVINFPGLDVGIEKTKLEERLICSRQTNGSYIIRSTTNEMLHTGIRNIEGRLIYNGSGAEVTIPPQVPGLYVLSVTNEAGITVTKKVWW